MRLFNLIQLIFHCAYPSSLMLIERCCYEINTLLFLKKFSFTIITRFIRFLIGTVIFPFSAGDLFLLSYYFDISLRRNSQRRDPRIVGDLILYPAHRFSLIVHTALANLAIVACSIFYSLSFSLLCHL